MIRVLAARWGLRVPQLTAQLEQQIIREVIEPVIQAFASQGTPYIGFLYAGLMISPTGEPKVLEFNCRLGDPETQPILMRLQSDLVELCLAAVAGKLGEMWPCRQWNWPGAGGNWRRRISCRLSNRRTHSAY